MNAPFCPVSRSQPVTVRGPAPVQIKLPVIPKATDLPSLIRAVNIIRDIMRTITTSLTVNNLYNPLQQPNVTYIASANPQWYQGSIDTKTGYVFHKIKDKFGNPKKDEDNRAYVRRLNEVNFYNTNRTSDKDFTWRYVIPLDSEYGASNKVPPFEEDFFERVVSVNWGGLAVEFGDKAEAPK